MIGNVTYVPWNTHMKKNRISGIFIFIASIIIVCTSFTKGDAASLHDVTHGGPPIITEEGILFRYEDHQNPPLYVMVSGDFNGWEKPLLMTRNQHSIYVHMFRETDTHSVVLGEGRYRYRYLVDGIWQPDPRNSNTVYDSYGTELSYFEIRTPIIILDQNPVHVERNRYIFYYEDMNARTVFLVGNFNNWNPYSHPMRKNRSGIWEISLELIPGAYTYRFLVDGIYRKDPLSTKIVYDKFDNQYSSVKLPYEEH
jgi:hypothetical protein